MRKKTCSLVLFDMDGTLVDTTEGVLKCVVHALKKMGRPVPNENELKKYMGPPLTQSFSEFAGMSAEDAILAEKIYRNRYRIYGKREISEYSGMREVLEGLSDTGCPMAVATSKLEKTAKEVLHSVGYLPYFLTVSGSDPAGIVSKKTEVILQALNRLGEDASPSVWMVGDRKYDVIGAKALSLTSVGIYTGNAEPNELEEAGADYVVHSPEDLLELLMSHYEPKP